jgi:hypothetical protein
VSDDLDSTALRIFVYDQIVANGKLPTLEDIGANFGTTAALARDALANLKIGKTILVDSRSGEIWMAGPFSANETNYRAVLRDRTWWANCAWDMLGIPMILKERVRVYASCTDSVAPMTIECDPATPPADDAVVHFLVPARRWYEDIGFT